MATPRRPRFPRSRRAQPGDNQLSLFDPDDAALLPGAETDDAVFNDAPVTNEANFDSWDYYDPTRTSNPNRPRTMAARYNKATRTIEVRFREGATYQYSDIHPNTWRGFKNTDSPGRYINRILNGHDYRRGSAGDF